MFGDTSALRGLWVQFLELREQVHAKIWLSNRQGVGNKGCPPGAWNVPGSSEKDRRSDGKARGRAKRGSVEVERTGQPAPRLLRIILAPHAKPSTGAQRNRVYQTRLTSQKKFEPAAPHSQECGAAVWRTHPVFVDLGANHHLIDP